MAAHHRCVVGFPVLTTTGAALVSSLSVPAINSFASQPLTLIGLGFVDLTALSTVDVGAVLLSLDCLAFPFPTVVAPATLVTAASPTTNLVVSVDASGVTGGSYSVCLRWSDTASYYQVSTILVGKLPFCWLAVRVWFLPSDTDAQRNSSPPCRRASVSPPTKR